MNQLITTETNTASMLMNPAAMQCMSSFATLMASGKVTVPKHLQGSPADCMAIAMQAAQWGMNPYAVAQKTHLVNGILGYEAQLVNAVLQASGSIVGRFHYEYQGEGAALQCRVGAIPAGESEVVWNEWLKSSDITTKNSPLWKTNPKQQIGYLQVKNWGRMYAPGAILGVYTPDELEDVPRAEVELNPVQQEKPVTNAAAALSAAKKTKAAAPVNFDEPEDPQLPPEALKLLSLLEDCQDIEQVNAWAADAAAQFPQGSAEFATLEAAYQAKYNYFSQNQ